ncbi:hypothetical protein HYH03_005080 [Edaphochlamys debaryana]|uniref:Uncharacterized protein n=1 Tax=Edaphochlamys debaryana TaxID=47281 RepID=A0A835Y6S6_9CHLO|nr:hypothetical protein HYH03_005080 [Edaphochlamys debaryana]|eukprot:KAG2497086.1 hypothetical protein HYH03_005080 [Edaphochlamys debaryana]
MLAPPFVARAPSSPALTSSLEATEEEAVVELQTHDAAAELNSTAEAPADARCDADCSVFTTTSQYMWGPAGCVPEPRAAPPPAAGLPELHEPAVAFLAPHLEAASECWTPKSARGLSQSASGYGRPARAPSISGLLHTPHDRSPEGLALAPAELFTADMLACGFDGGLRRPRRVVRHQSATGASAPVRRLGLGAARRAPRTHSFLHLPHPTNAEAAAIMARLAALAAGKTAPSRLSLPRTGSLAPITEDREAEAAGVREPYEAARTGPVAALRVPCHFRTSSPAAVQRSAVGAVCAGVGGEISGISYELYGDVDEAAELAAAAAADAGLGAGGTPLARQSSGDASGGSGAVGGDPSSWALTKSPGDSCSLKGSSSLLNLWSDPSSPSAWRFPAASRLGSWLGRIRPASAPPAAQPLFLASPADDPSGSRGRGSASGLPLPQPHSLRVTGSATRLSGLPKPQLGGPGAAAGPGSPGCLELGPSPRDRGPRGYVDAAGDRGGGLLGRLRRYAAVACLSPSVRGFPAGGEAPVARHSTGHMADCP